MGRVQAGRKGRNRHFGLRLEKSKERTHHPENRKSRCARSWRPTFMEPTATQRAGGLAAGKPFLPKFFARLFGKARFSWTPEPLLSEGSALCGMDRLWFAMKNKSGKPGPLGQAEDSSSCAPALRRFLFDMRNLLGLPGHLRPLTECPRRFGPRYPANGKRNSMAYQVAECAGGG